MSRKHPRLSEEQRLEAISRYQSLEPMEDISISLNVSRQCIFKLLKKAGINTSKSFRVERTCSVCGKPVIRTRQRARDTKTSYCSRECFEAWLTSLGENYKPSSYYARISQETVRKHFPDYDPSEGHVIHHVNKDVSDMRKINLMVFASQGDHVRYHRGIQVTPLWNGASI